MKKPPATKVIFRKFSNGEVIAVFPQEPFDSIGLHCVSYAHVGQHGAASIDVVQGQTQRAKPEEYAPLKDELEALGYTLLVRHRTNVNDARIRYAKVNPPKA